MAKRVPNNRVTVNYWLNRSPFLDLSRRASAKRFETLISMIRAQVIIGTKFQNASFRESKGQKSVEVLLRQNFVLRLSELQFFL